MATNFKPKQLYTKGEEFIQKKAKTIYVGGYYRYAGKYWAGDSDKARKNPNQKIELIPIENKSRTDDGYLNSEYGTNEKFSYKLNQDNYETVSEIVDTEISELKPKVEDDLSGEALLKNRIDNLFQEYESLKNDIDRLGQSKSHAVFVKSSLPFTDEYDSETTNVSDIPTDYSFFQDDGNTDILNTTEENITTDFSDSDFLPGTIRGTKIDLEIEKLLHERGDAVYETEIERLNAVIDELNSKIGQLEAQIVALGGSNTSLQDQLDGALASLQEEMDDELGQEEQADDPDKGDVVWSEAFEFGEEQIAGEKEYMEGWNRGSIPMGVCPIAGPRGTSGVRLIRSKNDAGQQAITFPIHLKGFQTYTFTAYARFGSVNRIRAYIGETRRPAKPTNLSFNPFDWMYNWATSIDCSRTNWEDPQTGEWRWKGRTISNNRWHSQNNHKVVRLTPLSGSHNPDGTDGGEYDANNLGIWYKVEFDFTPQASTYQDQYLANYPDHYTSMMDGRYISSPAPRGVLHLYVDDNGDNSANFGVSDWCEWADIKIYERKNSYYHPEYWNGPTDRGNGEHRNRPIGWVEGVDAQDVFVNRNYTSSKVVGGRVHVDDMTYYRPWPPEWTKDKYGKRWAFNDTTNEWESIGVIQSTSEQEGDVPLAEDFDIDRLGTNLVQNGDFTNGMTNWSFVDTDEEEYYYAFDNDIHSKWGVANWLQLRDDGELTTTEQYGKLVLDLDTSPNPTTTRYIDREFQIKDGGWLSDDMTSPYPEIGDYCCWPDTHEEDEIKVMYQEIDVAGTDGLWFKLGSLNGGHTNQEDYSITYVRFYDADNRMVVPDERQTTVRGDSTGNNTIKYGGVEQPVYGWSQGSKNLQGYEKGNESTTLNYTWWWGFRCDYIDKFAREEYAGGNDNDKANRVLYSSVVSKVPPGAITARVFVHFAKPTSVGTKGNGYVDGILFKLSQNKPNESEIEFF